jgi:hypothetical protein
VRTSLETSLFSLAWPLRSLIGAGMAKTGQMVTDVQRHVRHPALGWMAATLEGRIESTGAVFEAKFVLPWSFSEEAAAAARLARTKTNLKH